MTEYQAIDLQYNGANGCLMVRAPARIPNIVMGSIPSSAGLLSVWKSVTDITIAIEKPSQFHTLSSSSSFVGSPDSQRGNCLLTNQRLEFDLRKKIKLYFFYGSPHYPTSEVVSSTV